MLLTVYVRMVSVHRSPNICTTCLLLFFLSSLQEARAIKLVVIYLALGCPERIRFEYDYVNTDFGNSEAGINNSLNSTFTASLSREAIANGEGMTNGLRRLLHLSASEYLNLKNFNVSSFS